MSDNCPMCFGPVRVVGRTTLHYESIGKDAAEALPVRGTWISSTAWNAVVDALKRGAEQDGCDVCERVLGEVLGLLEGGIDV